MRSYCFGALEVHPADRNVLVSGRAVTLGTRAFDLLLMLVEHRHRVVSTRELMDTIWPGLVVEENNLRQQVSALRKVLGAHAILTIPARGYQFGLERDADPQRLAQPAPQQPEVLASRGAGATVTDGRPSVAVLPFVNMSGDVAQDYVSDGVTQDIITRLSRFRWLHVLARNTTLAYKGLSLDARWIATDLRVSYLVAGSVRRSGSRIRVTAELVDASTGEHKWAQHYDRGVEDLFVMQDEITDNVVAQLEPQIGLAERQRVVRLKPADLQAWDCYHLGVAQFFRFTAQSNLEAQRLFQRSRQMDPEFGEAHAWWAYAMVLGMVYWDTDPTADLLNEALIASKRALELDDSNAVFYMLKARVQLARREYGSALIENELALRLNPTLAPAHCGLGDTLAYLERYDEAIVKFERALELSPRDPQRWAFLTYGALAMIFNRDFERALQWATEAAELPNHQYWTTAHQAVALARLGRREEARTSTAQLLARNPRFTCAYAREKLFYLKQPSQLHMYLEGLQAAGVPA